MLKSFSKNEKQIIVLLFLSWFVLVFMWQQDYDYSEFIQYWIHYLDESLFGCYTHLDDVEHFLNYPPLYILYLWLLRKPLLWSMGHHLLPVTLFLLKIGVWLFHFGFSKYLYDRVHKKFAWFWLLNPVFIYIDFTTIHIDEILCGVMFLCIYSMVQKRHVCVFFWFTIGCLLKLQGCYLLPVLLVYVWQNRKLYQKFLKYTFYSVGMALFVYLPFMIQSKMLLLPVRLYLKGFQSNYDAMELPIQIHGFFVWTARLWNELLYDFLMERFYVYLGIPILLCIIVYFVWLQKRVSIWLALCTYFYTIFYVSCSQNYRYFSYAIMFAGVLMCFFEDLYYKKLLNVLVVMFFANVFVNIMGQVVNIYRQWIFLLIVLYGSLYLYSLWSFYRFQKFVLNKAS